MSDAPFRIVEPGWGEAPPTAGLPPRWADLLFPKRDTTLERELCARFGFADVEIVSTGTAGLRIAFQALRDAEAGRNGVVVLPGYTCPLVVHAAAAAGLSCIACDTEAGGFGLDLAHLQRIVSEMRAQRTRIVAIVPTHYGGVLTDVGAVRAAAPGIPIVEDAAQALGATWGGKSAGVAGDIGVFSLGAGKGLTIYEGGALVAREPAMMERLRDVARRLMQADPLGEIGRDFMLAGYHAAYNPIGLRWVFGAPKRKALGRGDAVEAAGDRFDPEVAVTRVSDWRKRVGSSALRRLDDHLARCRARFEDLARRLPAIGGLFVHLPPSHVQPSATVLLAYLPPHPKRDAFIDALWRSRLGVTRMFSHAIGDYPELAAHMLPSATPNARELAAGTIAITTSPLASDATFDAIIGTLESAAREMGWKK